MMRNLHNPSASDSSALASIGALMPLETGTYLPDLNASNPAHTDGVNQADSHLRLIKSVLKNTFPNFTDVALSSTQAAIDGAVAALAGVFKVAADGTISAPAYSFASEAGLGLYRKASNTLACTIAGVDVWKVSGAGFDIITAGALLAGGSAIFPLQTANIGALQVTGAKLAANTVTYSKLQTSAAANVLLGSTSIGGTPQEITLGTGLSIISGVLTPAAQQPPLSGARNLVIVNDGTSPNTKVNITADQVAMLDGSGNSQRSFSVAVSIDFTTTGAGGVDVSTRQANKGYYLFLIGNGSTVAGIASLDSNGSVTMPGGYTTICPIGWYRTDGSSNLYRINTRGAKAQYIYNGAGNATQYPLVASGVQASLVLKSLSGFIAPNATEVNIQAYTNYNGGSASSVVVQPNATPTTSTAPSLMQLVSSGQVQPVSFVLEALSFGFLSTASGGAVMVVGWTNPS